MEQRGPASGAWRAARHQLLSNPTRLAIIDALADRPRGVAELAEIAAVHPNTVRSHLDRLEQAGLLDAETEPRGAPGRPAKRYRLRQPVEPPTHGQPQLLIRTVVSLARRAESCDPADVATEEGARVGHDLGCQLADEDADEHAWLLALLDRLSFAPQVAHRDGELEVDLLQCPFWGGPAEEDSDVVCAFHRGVLQGAASANGCDPQQVSLTPFVGPRRCRVTVPATCGRRGDGCG